MTAKHISVLLKETIDNLNLQPGDTLVDATFGGGGHSEYALQKYKGIKVLGIDQDENTLHTNCARLKKDYQNINCVVGNFRNIFEVLEKQGIKEVSAIIFDLGFSSLQLEDSGRGLSFKKDEPLLMTLSSNPGIDDLTAQNIVNDFSVETITDLLKTYGEERFAYRIAQGIVEARKVSPITTTFELVEVIKNSVPAFYQKGRIHFATKTFQALRIAANDELSSLKEGLQSGFECLQSGGHMAVISFHSLEDRIVKQFFKNLAEQNLAKIETKKPIVPSDGEVKENPRSRSAKLRIIKKIPE